MRQPVNSAVAGSGILKTTLKRRGARGPKPSIASSSFATVVFPAHNVQYSRRQRLWSHRAWRSVCHVGLRKIIAFEEQRRPNAVPKLFMVEWEGGKVARAECPPSDNISGAPGHQFAVHFRETLKGKTRRTLKLSMV